GEQFLGVMTDNEAKLHVLPSFAAEQQDLTWWPAFEERGRLTESAAPAGWNPATRRDPKGRAPADCRAAGAVAIEFTLAPKAHRDVTFMLAWYMPHLMMLEASNNADAKLYKQHRWVKDAFDDKPDTRWTTDHVQRRGDALTLAM